MPEKRARNAKYVLPSDLLSKLRKYCTGLVYIPSMETRAQRNRTRVAQLYAQGLHHSRIAHATGLSDRQVRNLIKQIDEGHEPPRQTVCDALKNVPPELVKLVQRCVVGLVYIPPKSSVIARRHARIRRLLREGIPLAEISRRTGLSERHLRRLKRAFRDIELDAPTPPVKSAPQPKPLRICPRCQRAVVIHGRYCDVCRDLHGFEDGSVYVPDNFPFAILD